MLRVVICLVATLAATSVGARDLTLSQAAEQMAASDLSFDIIRREGDIAEELVRQAFGQRLPRVALTVDYVETEQEITNNDNTAFVSGKTRYPVTRVTLALNQPIYDRVGWSALPLAEAEGRVQQARAELATSRLLGELVAAFLDVGGTELGVERERSLVAAREQLEDALRTRVDEGAVSSDVLARAQSDTFAAQTDLMEAEMDLSDALFELARLTDTDVTGVQVSVTDLGVAQLQQFTGVFSRERLLELSPEVQVAKAELDVAERRIAQARHAFQPTAQLTLQYQYEDTEGSLFGGGSTVSSFEAGIGAKWTIYEGGIRASRVREVAARRDIAALQLKQAEEIAVSRYNALVAGLERTLGAVSAAQSEVQASDRRLSLVIRSEAEGRATAEDVLEARLRRDRSAIEAQQARLRAVAMQARLYELYGALDIGILSRELSGGA